MVAGDARIVRVALAADIAKMHAIRTSVRENRLSDPRRVRRQDYERMLTERGRGWVCVDQGLIVGFAIADLQTANVWALFVAREFEAQGVARELQRIMLDWMFASGASKVWLSTEQGTRAERFYRTAGWQAAGEMPNGELRFELTAGRWASLRA